MCIQNFSSALFAKNTYRGQCVGFGVSLKTFTVKYLFCSLNEQSSTPDFTVKSTAVQKIDKDKIYLSSLRPVLAKSCVKLFYDMPVYTQAGVFFGRLKRIEIKGNSLVLLFTENMELSVTEISACADAIILRKTQPYPLGQRIPAYDFYKIASTKLCESKNSKSSIFSPTPA